jgi:hypothetical protein
MNPAFGWPNAERGWLRRDRKFRELGINKRGESSQAPVTQDADGGLMSTDDRRCFGHAQTTDDPQSDDLRLVGTEPAKHADGMLDGVVTDGRPGDILPIGQVVDAVEAARAGTAQAMPGEVDGSPAGDGEEPRSELPLAPSERPEVPNHRHPDLRRQILTCVPVNDSLPAEQTRVRPAPQSGERRLIARTGSCQRLIERLAASPRLHHLVRNPSEVEPILQRRSHLLLPTNASRRSLGALRSGLAPPRSSSGAARCRGSTCELGAKRPRATRDESDHLWSSGGKEPRRLPSPGSAGITPRPPAEGCLRAGSLLGEGRFDVPERAVSGVARLYDQLQGVARSGNEEAFARILPDLLDEVRTQGEYLGTEQLDDDDALFAPADATIQDARVTLASSQAESHPSGLATRTPRPARSGVLWRSPQRPWRPSGGDSCRMRWERTSAADGHCRHVASHHASIVA